VSDDRFRPPSAPVADHVSSEVEYVGFWARVGASLIDWVLILAVTYPILVAVYGVAYFDTQGLAGPVDALVSWLFPAVASIAFWLTRQATPGKMAISARVVDARTGRRIGAGQALIRYLGYFISFLPLGLGALWVVFDRRKQGWHDKLARTVVVRPRRSSPEPVRFETA